MLLLELESVVNMQWTIKIHWTKADNYLVRGLSKS